MEDCAWSTGADAGAEYWCGCWCGVLVRMLVRSTGADAFKLDVTREEEPLITPSERNFTRGYKDRYPPH